jgi:hypothetical protein
MGSSASVEVTIDKENNLVTRVVRGNVTAEDLHASISEVLEHPDFHAGMQSLTDMRDAAPSSKPSEIMAIAEVIKEKGSAFKGAKAAVVVSERVAFAMARALKGYAGKSTLQIRVFYDMDEARRWLALTD